MDRRRFLYGASLVIFAGCLDPEDDDIDDEEDVGDDEPADDVEDDEIEDADDVDDEEVDPDEALDEGVEEPVDGLEFVEHELIEDDIGNARVEGIVANNTGDELDYVEVGVELLDDENRRIDDSFTNTTDLADGQEWVFEVMTTTEYDEVADYNITVVDSPF